jgi:hypothetical protein
MTGPSPDTIQRGSEAQALQHRLAGVGDRDGADSAYFRNEVLVKSGEEIYRGAARARHTRPESRLSPSFVACGGASLFPD